MSMNNNLRETEESARFRLAGVSGDLLPLLEDLTDMHIPVFTAVLDQTSGLVITSSYHNWGKSDGFDILLSHWYFAEVRNGRFGTETANAVAYLTQNDVFSWLKQRGYEINSSQYDLSKIPVVNPELSESEAERYQNLFVDIFRKAKKDGISGIIVFGTKEDPRAVDFTRNGKEAANMYMAGLDDLLKKRECSPECLWLYIVRMYLAWDDLQKIQKENK